MKYLGDVSFRTGRLDLARARLSPRAGGRVQTSGRVRQPGLDRRAARPARRGARRARRSACTPRRPTRTSGTGWACCEATAATSNGRATPSPGRSRRRPIGRNRTTTSPLSSDGCGNETAAERHLRQALERNPSYRRGPLRAGDRLSGCGRPAARTGCLSRRPRGTARVCRGLVRRREGRARSAPHRRSPARLRGVRPDRTARVRKAGRRRARGDPASSEPVTHRDLRLALPATTTPVTVPKVAGGLFGSSPMMLFTLVMFFLFPRLNTSNRSSTRCEPASFRSYARLVSSVTCDGIAERVARERGRPIAEAAARREAVAVGVDAHHAGVRESGAREQNRADAQAERREIGAVHDEHVSDVGVARPELVAAIAANRGQARDERVRDAEVVDVALRPAERVVGLQGVAASTCAWSART